MERALGLTSHAGSRAFSYLADRNFLVDDPKDKTFSAFGDARYKIEGGVTVLSREIYFATYQSIAQDERRPGLYKEFPPDFFDLIIVDECHRGSAREEANWREILEYFEPAYQLGMTATPLRDENRDTYLYFGNPLYTYSLKQGIDDGFLAPYRVHRIVTQWDAAGWRPSKDDLDRYGREIPDEVYTHRRFRAPSSPCAPAPRPSPRHLTDFLKKTDRFAKTIVFCVDQEHASEMRAALNNLNADLVGSAPRPSWERGRGEGGQELSTHSEPQLTRPFPDYVCRVTSDEGDIGRGHMQRFQDVETRTPVILTTSQLLTTGLDAPTCHNIVLAAPRQLHGRVQADHRPRHPRARRLRQALRSTSSTTPAPPRATSPTRPSTATPLSPPRRKSTNTARRANSKSITPRGARRQRRRMVPKLPSPIGWERGWG